jgi:protocatechuate 4,5-dioxygenase, beta chain
MAQIVAIFGMTHHRFFFRLPLRFVTPDMSTPIVPILANCQAPPIPRAERFYEIGSLLRDVIERIPGNKRIGVITSGHFSLELGGPKQFGRTTADPAFDAEALRWIREADAPGALAGSSFERLTAAGNVSQAFLTLVLAMGVARATRPIYLETLAVLGTIEGFVAWDPLREPQDPLREPHDPHAGGPA